MRATRRSLLAIVAAGAAVACAGARAAWPERPVKIVVPFAPGAMGDILARMLGQELQQALGQPVVVENKAGAGGNIGSGAVARASPDGHTFLVGATNNFVINQIVYPNLGFDPLRAFDPVSMLVDVPSVLLSSALIAPRSVAELIEASRKQPGRFNYGSPGNATTPHLWLDEISRTRDMKMTHVPYQGAAQVVQALITNEVQVGLFGAGVALAQIRAGRIRALAVSSDERLASLPDVPTFAEAGLGKIEGGNWWALAAPAGTPPDSVDRLAGLVQAIFAKPAIRARLLELGVVPAAGGPAALARTWQDDAARWKKRIDASGAKIN
ncbi:MAG: Bug family tripartite tricarboxylate transporter substrate binding protein [Lautropia sp.]